MVTANTLFQQHKRKLYTWTSPDLNQTPNKHTVDMRSRFKGLNLIDRVPDGVWMQVHDIVQETVIKTIPKKKKCKEIKMRPYK